MKLMKNYLISMYNGCRYNDYEIVKSKSHAIPLGISFVFSLFIYNVILTLLLIILVCLHKINTQMTFHTIYFWILYMQFFKMIFNVFFYEVKFIHYLGSEMSIQFIHRIIYVNWVIEYLYFSCNGLFFYMFTAMSVLNLYRLLRPFEQINKRILHAICIAMILFIFIIYSVIFYRAKASACYKYGEIHGYGILFVETKFRILMIAVNVFIPWMISMFILFMMYKLTKKLGSKSEKLKRLSIFINIIYTLMAVFPMVMTFQGYLEKNYYIIFLSCLMISDFGQNVEVILIFHILLFTDFKFKKLFIRFGNRFTESTDSKRFTSIMTARSTSESTDTWSLSKIALKREVHKPIASPTIVFSTKVSKASTN